MPGNGQKTTGDEVGVAGYGLIRGSLTFLGDKEFYEAVEGFDSAFLCCLPAV